MHHPARFAALALAAVVAACSSGQSDMGDIDPPDMNVDRTTWMATIEPTSDAGHGGSATVWLEGDQTVARVTLTHGSAGGHHPWHIHRGTCGSGGGVVGSGSDYPQLHPASDADAVATARLNVVLDENASYYINIHQSSSAMGTIVGCGNLVKR